MERIKKQIQELLSQDLMLEVNFKQQVLEKLENLNEEQLNNIVATLQSLVNEESEVLVKVVEANPYFFIELQQKILKVMQKDFAKRETINRKIAEQNLKTDLETL